MKITKAISSLVLTAVLLTSVSPLTNANEIQTNNTKTAHQSYENINGVKINRNPNLPMNPEAQQRFGGTKWSEVPANAVGDAVKRGAINAGLSKSDAGIISTVVKEAIAWLF